MIRRRGFIAGLGALLAAPAIIRTPGLIMPIKPLAPATPLEIFQPFWVTSDLSRTMLEDATEALRRYRTSYPAPPALRDDISFAEAGRLALRG